MPVACLFCVKVLDFIAFSIFGQKRTLQPHPLTLASPVAGRFVEPASICKLFVSFLTHNLDVIGDVSKLCVYLTHEGIPLQVGHVA
jgi:hypothetical protein